MSIALAPGMTGAWAEQYKAWLPFARQAVLETVDRWGTAAAIRELAGTDLADEMIELLRRDWYQPFRSYLNRTGKMIRPVLVCLTARSLGADPVKAPSLVAMAEMIHSSSLVLDDIADDSDLRRGEPTAHRMVGVCTAGALGSSWLNMCFDILANSQSNLHDSSRRRLGRELAWEHWVTGLGTTIDTIWPSEESMDHDPLEYLQSVLHRSTSYTYRMPFKIGASIANADGRAAELVRILRASTTDQRELRNAVASCGSVGRSPRRGQSQISTWVPACASSPIWTSSTARIASCGAVLYHIF